MCRPWRNILTLYQLTGLIVSILSQSDSNSLYDEERGIVFEGYVDDYMKLNIGISKQIVQDFRRRHELKKDTILHLQKISPMNSIRLREREYYIDEILPMKIFEPDARYVLDDEEEPIPLVNIFFQDFDDESIMVTRDKEGSPKSITIFNKMTGSSVDFKKIAPAYFAQVNANDADIENLRKKFLLKEGKIGKPNPELITTQLRSRSQQDEFCLCKKVVQIAIAYESSFCEEAGGKDNAIFEVAELIGSVSQKYGQSGVCTEWRVSYVEGFCTPLLDPYKKFVDANKSGCEGYGLLDRYRDFWEKKRILVPRDTSHLLSGTGLECGPYGGCTVGCAYISSICTDEAYGVSHATFSANSNVRAVLIAHELGHNFGASHFHSNSDYIMYPNVNDAVLGFSPASKRSFENNSFSCLGFSIDHLFPDKERIRKNLVYNVLAKTIGS